MCAGRFHCGTPSRHSAKGNSRTRIPALPPTSRVILGRTHHLSGAQLHLSKKSIGSDHLKAPSSSDLLDSLLSREPHPWGRGNRSVLSAQVQPTHTLAHLPGPILHIKPVAVATLAAPPTPGCSPTLPHLPGPQVVALFFRDCRSLGGQRKRMGEKREG